MKDKGLSYSILCVSCTYGIHSCYERLTLLWKAGNSLEYIDSIENKGLFQCNFATSNWPNSRFWLKI